MKPIMGDVCLSVFLLYIMVQCVNCQPNSFNLRDQFNYDIHKDNRFGMYNWHITYSQSCNGITQSPVDIQTNNVRFKSLSCPRMLYRSSLLWGNLRNNGRTVGFRPEDSNAYRLDNIPYRPGIYNLMGLHIHYGGLEGRYFDGQVYRGDDSMFPGSEHTIDGVRMDGEIHVVFYNSKYGDFRTALRRPDGLVVLALHVEIVYDSMFDSSLSQFLEMNIPDVISNPSNVSLNLDMNIFFNQECEFYTYYGSTTVPYCRENVQWFIFREPLRVSERAWFQLSRLQSRGGFSSRYGNYRDIKPLNNRIVKANFRTARGPLFQHEIASQQFAMTTTNVMPPSPYDGIHSSLPPMEPIEYPYGPTTRAFDGRPEIQRGERPVRLYNFRCGGMKSRIFTSYKKGFFNYY